MRAKEVTRRIVRLGGELASQRGSHAKYRVTYTRPDGSTATVRTIVAMHGGDVPTGTLRSIERDLAPAFGEGWLTR